LHEKGCQQHAMPCYHNRGSYLRGYIDGTGLAKDFEGFCFRALASVATSGTDFTAPEADFAALIRAARFCPESSHLSRGSCRVWDSLASSWR
jgi:hypothetical protein